MLHVVEDEPILLQLLEEIISEAGHPVRCFMTGDSYLDYLNHPTFTPPKAVICDVHIPGADGYKLATILKQKVPDVPVILTTGKHDDEHIEKVQKIGCHSLSKPFMPMQIVTLLESLISPSK
ncbi:MAG: response regulator [Methanobacteriota archaeon]|nr:MAG: response regulator [Euryarchaeota archaeon]